MPLPAPSPDHPPSLAHHPWDTSLAPEVAPLFLALQWAQARSLEVMAPVLRRHGLSLAEFDVLATLRNALPPYELTPSAIQQRVVITSGGLSKVLGQLSARGWVIRSQSTTDQRIKPVRLSPLGESFIEAAMADVLAASTAWIRCRLGQEDIRQATELLTRLAGELPALAADPVAPR